MTPNEYQRLALRTESPLLSGNTQATRLLHAAMGFATETGEFFDPLKRNTFYGRPLNDQVIANLKEEVGDILWYCAVAAEGLGTDLEALMVANINKLRARFPDRFDAEKANGPRDYEAEHKAASGT